VIDRPTGPHSSCAAYWPVLSGGFAVGHLHFRFFPCGLIAAALTATENPGPGSLASYVFGNRDPLMVSLGRVIGPSPNHRDLATTPFSVKAFYSLQAGFWQIVLVVVFALSSGITLARCGDAMPCLVCSQFGIGTYGQVRLWGHGLCWRSILLQGALNWRDVRLSVYPSCYALRFGGAWSTVICPKGQVLQQQMCRKTRMIFSQKPSESGSAASHLPWRIMPSEPCHGLRVGSLIGSKRWITRLEIGPVGRWRFAEVHVWYVQPVLKRLGPSGLWRAQWLSLLRLAVVLDHCSLRIFVLDQILHGGHFWAAHLGVMHAISRGSLMLRQRAQASYFLHFPEFRCTHDKSCRDKLFLWRLCVNSFCCMA